MLFEDFASAWQIFLAAGFILALVMGAVVNKTGFCTMGAVSDWVNIGDTGRFRAWFLAMGIAMLGVIIFEYLGVTRPDDAFPPYRMSDLVWLENILGGLMFGVGMTFASGCGNKNLVRLGAGNFKALIVLSIIALIAYFMVNPFPGSDKTLFSTLFYPWTSLTTISLDTPQDLGSMLAGTDNVVMGRLIVGLILGLGLVFIAFMSKDFRKDKDHALAGIVIGLAVLGAWITTSLIMVNADGEIVSLSSYYTDWDLYAFDDVGKPAMGAPLSPQSYTFINPTGQALGYLAVGKAASNFLTFGIVAALGVIVGSFLWALFSKGLRFEWFASFKDFYTHVIGAILMGFGGVLGMGCTIGQGITGVSTLALGSFLTVFSIIIASALTMKVQYYKMVYEEEASFAKALVAGMADLKLLPDGLRKLDKV
ncbi:MAG: YeeE/YedE family protein [Proteobacteria bacterium]|nr:YeeE/YedE family protein [Pseudomonadota bacterium]